ncbi:tyrosine-type recombinase/integrase [Natronorubrum daqingense]|uniref:Site-specific recombinase XerD n=1 Tax=Natronorubrum daqingense TaxID=588898 RepID=A0A1N7F5R8_9EURY|nr:tyrosine-type recombinase/integrase [Natronorubrum daqingense]SIR95664.1 Site-specific recombinase XerD [Natronorubrum daqingense]
MGNSPREKLQARRDRFEKLVKDGKIDEKTGDAIRELLNAYDENNVMVTKPKGESHRTPQTLMAWLYRLIVFSQYRDLTEATADGINRDVQDMHSGKHPHVQDKGLKKGTLRAYQAAVRRFYQYHDFEVDPNDIPLFDKEETSVDPNDMLTKEEIHEARDAIDNPRDLLIYDLLIYTGQRREALRTLRIKDVDPQEGTFRLNPEVDGLKGAAERNGNRPLLAAKATVQDWINNYHPDASDPEHYLITARPGYSRPDPTTPVSGETIRKVMENIKKETDITKPMHPHAMRHNFVTVAKRDYDIPDDTIKYLIGHDADSTVMESTYAHLSGDDHVQRAEEAFGIREPEEQSSFTPDVCRVCNNPLEPSAKACSNCGTVYTPDAQQTQEQIGGDMKRSYAETEPGDDETLDELDQLDELLENPEVKAALLEKLQE